MIPSPVSTERESKPVLDLLRKIHKDVEDYGCKIVLKKAIRGDADALGNFDEKRRIITCIETPIFMDWFSVLVHEVKHFEQWKRQVKVWIEYNKVDPNSEAWLKKGCTLTPARIQKELEAILNIEIDCEKRTIKTLKSVGALPPNYIKDCNLAFYKYVFSSRHKAWPVFDPNLLSARMIETKRLITLRQALDLPFDLENFFSAYIN